MVSPPLICNYIITRKKINNTSMNPHMSRENIITCFKIAELWITADKVCERLVDGLQNLLHNMDDAISRHIVPGHNTFTVCGHNL